MQLCSIKTIKKNIKIKQVENLKAIALVLLVALGTTISAQTKKVKITKKVLAFFISILKIVL